MSSHFHVGIIAEDQSDYDALTAIIAKLKSNCKFAFKPALGKGAGKLVRKCNSWSKVLKDKGCAYLVIVRDSDGQDAKKLEKEIQDALNPSHIEKHVISIAVHELESWLLADINAIHKVFSLANAPTKEIASPENIQDAKEHLAEIAKSRYGKKYLNTIHNKRIAALIDVSKIKAKCPSFLPLEKFVNQTFLTS